MYTDFYALTAIPFRLSPDSRFFFGSHEHNRAMAFLQYGIAQGEGFVIVTGEVGAGKTTLVEQMLSTLDSTRYVAGRIVTTQLDAYDTLCMVAASFGISHENRDKASLVVDLKKLFEKLWMAGKRALLVVDEAQSLTGEAVEELRMLSNLQCNGETAFQVILLGQPEFRQLLSSTGFEQVRQRVAASCHLGPLDAADTRLYIEHRLTQVGWRDDPHITNDAFTAVFRASSGIPRRINTIFSRLLLLGFLDQKHTIDGQMVEAVAGELFAELGPSSIASPSLVQPVATAAEHIERSEPQEALVDLETRLRRIEDTVERHNRVIRRALNAAGEYASSKLVSDDVAS